MEKVLEVMDEMQTFSTARAQHDMRALPFLLLSFFTFHVWRKGPEAAYHSDDNDDDAASSHGTGWMSTGCVNEKEWIRTMMTWVSRGYSACNIGIASLQTWA